MKKIVDTHIHFDFYEKTAQEEIVKSLKSNHIEGLITVSQNLASAKKNLALAEKYARVYPAFGYHPEQPIPQEQEIEALFTFIKEHEKQMVAVGEVGLPYYLRKEQNNVKIEEYIELLEQFIILAKALDKPIILHAVYEDAAIACDLLEKHSMSNAHFHWFKGDAKTVARMQENGYYISVTPDVLYESEIQQLVKSYPIEQIMVETDGPWPFVGPFENKMTHPRMIHDSMQVIAKLKQLDLQHTYNQIYQNTNTLYQLK